MKALKQPDFLYRITHWETWHYLVKYIPISPAWLWYCLRSGSFWFFTPSNPTLTFGGFEGESKNEMYMQLPPGSYPKSIFISHDNPFVKIERLVNESGFFFPIAVKPDVGMMGFMFRKIENIEQLRKYHKAMHADYIIQDLIEYPLEVSVFYYRYPNESSGHITGFLKKEFLEVEGDGRSTLQELIMQYPRVRFRIEEMEMKHEKRLNDVIPKGERYCLSYALNLSRGGKLVSLAHEKDSRLLKVFDDLSNYSKHFYYGRYDIKCLSIEDLKQGKNFSILEYNGSGAEPHHIYGDGNSLIQAYRIVLHHWKVLYTISKLNHNSGQRYWKHRRGVTFLKRAKEHFRLLKKLDATFEM
ncbi:MAG: hypothetical protein ABI691_15750 [Ginsengibacter sp.]